MGRWAVVAMSAVAAGCFLGSGCAPTYQDPATGVEARYEWETLKAKLNRPIAEVYYAARDAAEDLDLRPLRCGLDGIAAEVVALDAHCDRVDIRVGALPESRSLLAIRVGFLGDMNKSAVLFSEIMERLARCEDKFSKYFAPDDDP